MQDMEKIIASLEQPMLDTLCRWIRVPSVKGEPEDGAPFGRPAREALDLALKTCEELGFRTENVDGYAGHADLGEGDTKDALAILGHLDVVPVGDGWTKQPFSAEISDGKIFGRGTADDKGPVAAALYAMKAVQLSGVPLKRKVRLILGTDEESGWADIDYYKTKVEMPRQGFSPDADYPLINIEKGGLHVELHGENDRSGLEVLSFNVGERYNVIPGQAVAVVAGGQALADRINGTDFGFPVDAKVEDGAVRIHTEGVPGHAAMPEYGRNAIGQMLLVLKKLGVKGMLASLADKIGLTYDGEGLKIRMEDKVSGKLTCSMGIIRADREKVFATLDIRCPILADPDALVKMIARSLPDVRVVGLGGHDAHYVDADSELVQSLLSAYTEVTGQQGYAFAIGGGTYAKCLEEGVAFGALFPGEQEMAHQADEYISVDSLKKNLRIFTYAILKLAAK